LFGIPRTTEEHIEKAGKEHVSYKTSNLLFNHS